MRRLILNARPFMAQPQARQCCYRYMHACGLSSTASDALEHLLSSQAQPTAGAGETLELRWESAQQLTLLIDTANPLSDQSTLPAGWRRGEIGDKTCLSWSSET